MEDGPDHDGKDLSDDGKAKPNLSTKDWSKNEWQGSKEGND